MSEHFHADLSIYTWNKLLSMKYLYINIEL